MTTIKKSFIASMLDYFGLRQSQTRVEFLNEIKALSPVEKDWFEKNLSTVGYEVIKSI